MNTIIDKLYFSCHVQYSKRNHGFRIRVRSQMFANIRTNYDLIYCYCTSSLRGVLQRIWPVISTTLAMNRTRLPGYCMKDLDFRGNILSGTKYRVSPEGVSLMDETNNLAKYLLEILFIKPHGRIVTEQLMIGSWLSDWSVNISTTLCVRLCAISGLINC